MKAALLSAALPPGTPVAAVRRAHVPDAAGVHLDAANTAYKLVQYLGGYQAIARDPATGVLTGASESRKDGMAAGY